MLMENLQKNAKIALKHESKRYSDIKKQFSDSASREVVSFEEDHIGTAHTFKITTYPNP